MHVCVCVSLSAHLWASLAASPSSPSPSFSFLGDFWNFTLVVHAVSIKNGLCVCLLGAVHVNDTCPHGERGVERCVSP